MGAKTTFLFLLLGIFSFSLSAQEAVKVVQQQLDTYNAQDLDGFVNTFSEDAQVFSNLGDAEPSMVGRGAIRERYGAMFEKNPENKSILIGRLVQGNYVYDHEYIVGRADPFKIVAIYEVKDGLIQRCWFTR